MKNFLALLLLLSLPASATEIPEGFLDGEYGFRSIGPYRGGRSAAVAGVPGDPLTWYFGGTGGGVFKSTDGGNSWSSVSDGYFGGSIGAVAVAPSDPNVIWVGGGEKTVRGNVSHGYGVFRSTDAGRTWESKGLLDSRHIGRIRVHPQDPDVAYVSAMGHLFGPNRQRGLYRTTDGGESWVQILFVDENTGCVDLAMDPTNPRILYASFWRVRRTPYSLESGGEGSSMHKSVDGGDTWTEITRNEGLPQGIIGINCITVSPKNPDRLWAIVEAEDGGVFRSEDAGETWARVNDERKLRQRAWYYTRIYADTGDEDTVYVLNVRFWKSKDGGKTFESIQTPHGDHHDLWIDPEEPRHFVIGDDGGAQVTFDGGENFTTYHNQPTAQFYRVTTDDSFPWRIYGAQQDNSTVRIRHRSDGNAIGEFDWEPTAGGESGWIAPDPRDNEIVYGGSYGGFLTRKDHRTGSLRAVNVWPDNPMGHGAEGMKERFQWNFPILFSMHEEGLLYAAGNRLWVTRDEGQSWEAISEDLTRNDPERLGPSGGPITKDNTGVEYYCTIFALAEDRHAPGAIWAGSDDGLVHVTRDGGATWTDVTPRGLPEWAQINCIEADPHREGAAYLAATRYKSDDFRPYLYRTDNWGKSWKKIVSGIDAAHFTRAIRVDPMRPGLLYAGTESGLYVSLDDGKSWQSLQLDLPIVPITDLAVKENTLVVATQGRSFWLLDDLKVIQQLDEEAFDRKWVLFDPRDPWRMGMYGRWGGSPHRGEDLPDGAILHYRFGEKPDSSIVSLEILDAGGEVLRTFAADDEESPLPAEAGMNQFVWNLRTEDAEGFDGLVMWAGQLDGPRVVPGDYRARLLVGTDSMEVGFELKQDPRSDARPEDLQAQYDFLATIRDELSAMHGCIKQIRVAREQIDAVVQRAEGTQAEEAVAELSQSLLEDMKAVEEALYQTQNRSRQDPLNFPIRLNDKLAGVARTAGIGDWPPTDQARAVYEELHGQVQEQLGHWEQIRSGGLAEFNSRVAELQIPAVRLDGTDD
jgi:photosystem II stability/assembly factor-like uncharacterized protein